VLRLAQLAQDHRRQDAIDISPRRVIASQSGARTRARLSEAIHRRHSKKSWIASSQGLLAMTDGICGKGAPWSAIIDLSTGAEKRASVPSKIARNTPDPVPLILLGRLAADLNHQGMGIGAGLLKDAVQGVAQISKAVGSRALIVHAIDHNAMAFYVKYGFIEFPQGSQPCFCRLIQSPLASSPRLEWRF
jgi:GNAT superfamily N-acetyltransferase